MALSDLAFGADALGVMGAYIVVLLLLGYVGRRQRQEESLYDHYLAGRSLGPVVLFLTMFATQYSGNTLFGSSGKAWRSGYVWLQYLPAMASIPAFVLLYAPRLFAIAERERFLTPSDYLYYRYRHGPLRVVVSLVLTYALVNYVIAQLKVMGLAAEGLSGGKIDEFWGVVFLAAVMLAYEWLGGMRSVAYTDTVQGVMLLLGFVALFVLSWVSLGGLPSAAAVIQRDFPAKSAVPDAEANAHWFSLVVILGSGSAIYPQMVQRIYAAHHKRHLANSLSLLAIMPYMATFVSIILGITAIPEFPLLAESKSDEVFALICTKVMEDSRAGYWTVVLLVSSLMAAVMSTADSALLSIASMLTSDVIQPYVWNLSERRQLALSKVITVASLALAVGISRISVTLVHLLEEFVLLCLLLSHVLIRYHFFLLHLWNTNFPFYAISMQIKMEALCQCYPAFLLGLHTNVRGRSVFRGICTGITVLVLVTFSAEDSVVGGLHAGFIGLVCNIAVIAADSFISGKDYSHRRETTTDEAVEFAVLVRQEET